MARTSDVFGRNTDWAPYTVIVSGSGGGGGKGTVVYDIAMWRKQGDSVEIMWVYAQSSTGAAVTGTMLCSLPIVNGSPLVADTTKCRASLTAGSVLGSVWAGRNALQNYTSPNVSAATIVLATTTAFSFIDGGNAATNLTTDAVYNSIFENYSGLAFSLTIKIPIVGWSNND